MPVKTSEPNDQPAENRIITAIGSACAIAFMAPGRMP